MREEIPGSNANETFVRSTYEIVYMTNATGMMRSQRCWIMSDWCNLSNLLPKLGSGAGEGIRTLDINLGKVALYQLSYARITCLITSGVVPQCQRGFSG